MLKKFLPKLNLHLLKKKQKQPQQENELQSPNLIFYSQTDTVVQNLLPRAVVFTTYFTAAVCILTFGLLTWNNSLDRRLSTLVSERDGYVQEITALTQVEKDLNEIVSLTNKHKSIKSQRLLLSSQVDYISGQIPPTMVLEELEYKERIFELNITSQKPLDIALLITGILQNDDFASIVITSVSLSNVSSGYQSSLEINLR